MAVQNIVHTGVRGWRLRTRQTGGTAYDIHGSGVRGAYETQWC